MRRSVGLVLIGLGSALLVLALALPGYVYPRVADVPPDPDVTIEVTGRGMTVLLPRGPEDGGPALLPDATVRVTRRLDGEVRPSARRPAEGEAFYRLAVRSEVEGRGLLSAYVEGASFDVRTGETTNCCGDYVRTSPEDIAGTPVEHSGLLFKFPFGTQRRDYPLWDVTIRAPETARFDGTERIEGLLTYRFVQTVEDEVVGRVPMPGAVFGSRQQVVPADRVYATVRTLWIEPRTGAIIKGSDRTNQRLRAGGREVPLLVGTLTYTDRTVQENADRARDAARGLRIITGTGPTVCWILGPLLILAGLGSWTRLQRGTPPPGTRRGARGPGQGGTARDGSGQVGDEDRRSWDQAAAQR